MTYTKLQEKVADLAKNGHLVISKFIPVFVDFCGRAPTEQEIVSFVGLGWVDDRVKPGTCTCPHQDVNEPHHDSSCPVRAYGEVWP